MEWTSPATPDQAAHLAVPDRQAAGRDTGLHFFQLFSAPRFQWWRGIVAILIALGSGLLLLTITSVIQIVVALSTNVVGPDEFNDQKRLIAALTNDPTSFAISNVQLGCGILVGGLAIGLGYWVRPWFASNVTGRIRWGLTFQCIAIAFLTLGLWNIITTSMEIGGEWHLTPRAWWLFAVVLVTTPLQCAGEEFVFRGALSQVIGGWVKHRVWSFIVPAVISASLFGVAHGPGDFAAWFTFTSMGLVFSCVVLLTGGLEGSIGIHIANNVALMAPVALSGQLGDALAANGDAGSLPSYLLSVIPNLVAGALIVLWCRWRKAQTTHTWPAPRSIHEPFSFPRDGQRDPFAPPTGLVEVPGGPGERSQWRPAPDARPAEPQGDGSPVAGDRRDW